MAVATKLLVPEGRSGLVARPELIAALEAGRARRVTVVAAADRLRQDEHADRMGGGPARRASPGCRSTRATTTRSGSGATWWPRSRAPRRSCPARRGAGCAGPASRSPTRCCRSSSTSSRRSRSRSYSCSTTTTRSRTRRSTRACSTCSSGSGRRSTSCSRRGPCRRCGSAGCGRADELNECRDEHAALQRGGGGRAAQRRARPAARARRAGRSTPPNRGLGGRAQPRRAVAAGDRRSRCVPGRDAGRRPLPRRLPVGRGRGPAAARHARLPDADRRARAAVERAVRRRARAARQRRDAARARAQQPVRDPARRRPALVPLPHDVPRHAAAPARALRARTACAELHRRASAWFADRGDVHGTIEHAISAGDAHVAAETLRRSWLALYSDGKANEAIGWIDRLPADTIAEYPDLALARGGVSRAMGRPIDEVEPWLGAGRAGGARCRGRARARRADGRRGAPARDAQARPVRRRRGGAPGPRGGRAAAARARPRRRATRTSSRVCLFWTGAGRETEKRLRDYLDAVPPGEHGRAPGLRDGAAGRRARRAAASSTPPSGWSKRRSPPPRPGARPSIRRPSWCTSRLGMVLLAPRRRRGRRGLARARRDARPARRRPDRDRPCRCCGSAAAACAPATSAARRRRSTRRARALGGALVPGLVSLAEALEAEIREAPAPVPPEPGVDGEALSRRGAERARAAAQRPHVPRDRGAPRRSRTTTVRAHGRRIRRKLGAVTRGEAVTAARRLELI